jgi:hydroxymethylbilane synthase
MSSTTLRLGTRGSRLALWQAERVRDLVTRLPGAPRVEIVKISTSGDRIQHVALSQVGGRDFFTKDIEDALLDGRVDLAVHSYKDLATDDPAGLQVGAVLERADPRDALVAAPGSTLAGLPAGATIGTSSLRRKAFVARLRPDLRCLELRGNVPTRIRKREEGEYDALLLASAGLDRLGLSHHIVERLDPEGLTPAPAQGAVAVQIRRGDEATGRWVGELNHGPTARATEAERVLLNVLEGGCQVPVGALAVESGGVLRMKARVASLDGSRSVTGEVEGSADEPGALGRTLGARLLDEGAGEILAGIRNAAAG